VYRRIWKWMERVLGLLLPLVLLIAGCSPSRQEVAAKDKLERARSFYLKAKAGPDVQVYAPAALDDAGKTLQTAEQTKDYKMMDHLSYLAEKKSQIAVTLAEGKRAEWEREALGREAMELQLQVREQEIRLARKEAEARTREAEQARQAAAAEGARADRSRKEAEEARSIALAEAEKADKARLIALLEVERAEQAKREAEQARAIALAEAAAAEGAKRYAVERAQETERARGEAEAKAREAEQSRLLALAEAAKAEQAKAEMDQLSRELSDLKAKQTERGIVLTMGDVLFEFGKSELSSVAIRNVSKLADFLQQHPARNLLIEGHTDSVGSDEFNLALSGKRADAVRDQLVARGIAAERMTTVGYGKKYPVANNDTPAGRQQNRRVEVVILNEGVTPETQLRQ
jgi:outer membrane protein OmpA-like peptidoglycan-associated protein